MISGNPDLSRIGVKRETMIASVYGYRGRIYQWHKKDYARSIADFTEALRLDPQIEMVHYRRGQSYQAVGE